MDVDEQGAPEGGGGVVAALAVLERVEDNVCQLLEVAGQVARGLSEGADVSALATRYFSLLKEVREDLSACVRQCPPARQYEATAYVPHTRLWIASENLNLVVQQLQESAVALGLRQSAAEGSENSRRT